MSRTTNFIKKMISLIVCVTVLVSNLPADRYYAKENSGLELKAIRIHTADEVNADKPKMYSVIVKDGDFLFSVDDFAKLTGYKYHINGDEISFSRGSKKVIVNTKKNTIQQDEKYLGSAKLLNDAVEYMGNYYISAASLLPWLNVCAASGNGELYILRDDVSIWDYISDFDRDLPGLSGTYGEAIDACGYGYKAEVLAYLEKKGLSGWLKDVIWIVGSNYVYSTFEDYYNAFSEMIESEDTAVQTLGAFTENSNKLNALADWLKIFDSNAGIADEFIGISKSLGAAGKGADYVREYYKLWYTLQQDNTVKLNWLHQIVLDRNEFSYPMVISDAAMKVQSAYQEKYTAYFEKILMDIIDKGIEFPDGIAAAISGMFTGYLYDGSLAETMNLGMYYNLALRSEKIYRTVRGYGSSMPEYLTSLRAHACLCLYFNYKCCEVVENYAKSTKHMDVAKTYAEIKQKCLNWMAFFIDAESSAENDSFRYKKGSMKEVYSEELLNVFAKISIGEISSDISENTDNGASESDGFFAFFPDSDHADAFSNIVYKPYVCTFNKNGNELYYAFNGNNRYGTYLMYEKTQDEEVYKVSDNFEYYRIFNKDNNRRFVLGYTDGIYYFEDIVPGAQDCMSYTRGRTFGGAAIFDNTVFYVDESGSLCKHTWEIGGQTWNGKREMILEAKESPYPGEKYTIKRASENGTFVVVKNEKQDNPEYYLFNSNGEYVRESNEYEAYADNIRRDGSLAIVDRKVNGVHMVGYVDADGDFTEDSWVNKIMRESRDYYIDLYYSDGDIYYVTRDSELYVRRAGSFSDELVYSRAEGGDVYIREFHGIMFVTGENVYVLRKYYENLDMFRISLTQGNSGRLTSVLSVMIPTQKDLNEQKEDAVAADGSNEWMNGTWYLDDNSSCYIKFTGTFESMGEVYYKVDLASPSMGGSTAFIISDGVVKISDFEGYHPVEVKYNPYNGTLELTFDSYSYDQPGTYYFVRGE